MEIPETAVPCVKQMKEYLEMQGMVLTEAEVFGKLVEYNMLNESGEPTQYALDNGLVEQI